MLFPRVCRLRSGQVVTSWDTFHQAPAEALATAEDKGCKGPLMRGSEVAPVGFFKCGVLLSGALGIPSIAQVLAIIATGRCPGR